MFPESLKWLRHRLAFKLIVMVGLTLLLSVLAWSYSNISYQEKKTMENLAAESDRLSTTIKLGAHYAMMLNSREDIAETIKNISRQPEIKNIRIYNKQGQIKYSNQAEEIDRITRIRDEACYVCHRTEPPLSVLSLEERTRVFSAPDGTRLLGILCAIYNEPGCSTAACHVHPRDKKVLGALDVVLSLAAADREMRNYKNRTLGLALFVFFLTSLAVFLFILRFVNHPVARMMACTKRIAAGEPFGDLDLKQDDEMGQLARAITQMGREIEQKQAELNRQKDEYQNLFELVPRIISVQDRGYRLQKFNRIFADKFAPKADDFCFHAYKGLSEKCNPCPVDLTFRDGRCHRSEETGYNRDGTLSHWIVITSPLKNEAGEIVSAMEISLDITDRKLLEQELAKSEQKYHAIFNNIPNAIFVLDPESLTVLDCNDVVGGVYQYDRHEVINRPFTMFYPDGDREGRSAEIKTASTLNQVRHVRRDNGLIFVNIRVSPSEFSGQKVLLVAVSDITKRLEAEQQLSQASKLATLGEMATGVAHELNQPLSVIKTVSSFFMRKIQKDEPLDLETLKVMLAKVDSNVDRATKIITHMRLFARKSEVRLVPIKVNEVLERAFDIFNQQLKVRGIEVVWDLDPDQPSIMADPDRLEQVFINLLINARDAIEQKWEGEDCRKGDKLITLKTASSSNKLLVLVRDTGVGVDESCKDKIFDPFFTTKEVGKGTGLGLSISYGIIKEHGGDIRVSTDESPGACFIIELPIKKSSHD
ncbi:MAG: ATP-binding protein [Pseudomonadota bacterium]